ncbi:MAG: phosphatase PAP2 family protein [bacterium]|nr:phosphatase PAP2 family protein [bacterium]
MKRILIHVVAVLVFLGGLPVLAAEADAATASGNAKQEKKENKDSQNKGKKKKNTPFFKAVTQDLGHILSSPARIRGKDLLVIGGTALITGILIANDESIYRSFKDYQAKNKWVDDISPTITKLGLGEWNLSIAGLFYIGGLAFKDKRAKETARLTVMTFIHTGITVQLGKHLTGRQEPMWANGQDGWAGPSGFFKRYKDGQLTHYDAFPSGHTISIVGTATVIAEMYKKTVWVPILSYTTAALCGLSRVTENTHWLSDVFLGAVMGYAIGKFVVKRRNRLGRRSLNILPVATARRVSLGIQYVF